jgi:hypothetical protein
MKLVAKTATSSGTASFTGLNATSTADDEFHQGWRRVTTSPVQVQRGETLTISLEMNAEATAWWSADHFTLGYTPLPDGIEDFTFRPSSEDRKMYDIQGRKHGNLPVIHGFFILKREIFSYFNAY